MSEINWPRPEYIKGCSLARARLHLDRERYNLDYSWEQHENPWN